MKKLLAVPPLAIALGVTAISAHTQKDPMVGGSAMYPTKNIIQNAVESKDHTTGRGSQGRRPGRYPQRPGAFHRLRSDE